MDLGSWLLIIVALLGWGAWGIADKGALRTMHPLSIALAYTTASLLFDIASIAIVRPKLEFNIEGLKWAIPGALSANIAFLAYTFVLKKHDAAVITTITSAYPMVTVILAWLLLNETLNFSKILGIIFILLGGFFITK